MYAKILLALDGSSHSLIGGRIGLEIARNLGAELISTHIYDAGLHSDRFTEMEPVLPDQYQEEVRLQKLRDAHKDLITEGFAALSEGYLEEYESEAKQRGVAIHQVHKEGRNYVQLLKLIDELNINLVIMGASGLAQVDGQLGSTAARVLRMAKCDVLIAKKELSEDGSILACVDGSNDARAAVRKAVQLSKSLSHSLTISAAYDPQFHTKVFRKMGSSLTQKRQDQIGLANQEKLHDQIIDEGLGELYSTFLEQAGNDCAALGATAEKRLLQGKAYHAISQLCEEADIDLVVAGRYGHHRTDLVSIGSNSEEVARVVQTNVLIVSGTHVLPVASPEKAEMIWDEEALAALEKVPSFARPMARAAIENQAGANGATVIDLKIFKEVAGRFGMGKTL